MAQAGEGALMAEDDSKRRHLEKPRRLDTIGIKLATAKNKSQADMRLIPAWEMQKHTQHAHEFIEISCIPFYTGQVCGSSRRS